MTLYRFCNMGIALSVAFAAPARAAEPLSASEQAVFNFGFATQLGSGVYSLSGRTLQVYRLPFAYPLPRGESDRVAVRFTLPVTLGFVNFKPRDVVEDGLPEQVDSLGVVPGLAVAIDVRDDWTLEPFAEAGVARDSSDAMDQRVYAFGLRSEYEMPGDGDWRLHNELVHALVREPDADRTEDFTRFRIGVTSRRPFAASDQGRQPDWLGYGLAEIYTDVPFGPVAGDPDSNGGEVQYEFGVTFGATEAVHIWRIPLPRIGLGYRFGDDLSIYRIVFGAPW